MTPPETTSAQRVGNPTLRAIVERGMVRRMLTSMLVVAAFGLAGAVPAHAQEADSAVDPFQDFRAEFDADAVVDVPTPRNRVSSTTDGYDGDGTRVVIGRGSFFGADLEYDFSRMIGEEPEELWFRYFVRLDEDFDISTGGKLPGFGGVYTATGKGGKPGTALIPGWSARVRMYPSDGEGTVGLGWYVYHVDQRGRYGDSFRWEGEGAGLRPGRWHCLEGHVAMNTPGTNDGALEAWVDGIAVHSSGDLRFRRSGESWVKVESFWFDVYHGGKLRSPRTIGMTFDGVEIGSERVGCGWDAVLEPTTADVTGDGVEDLIAWTNCPGGCFTVRAGGAYGFGPATTLTASTPLARTAFELGVVALDVDGDGVDDLAYPGVCREDCWRVQRGSTGNAEVWGSADLVAVERLSSGDVDGDGRDDLLLLRSCSGEWCIDTQRATDGGSFAAPERLLSGLQSLPRRIIPGEFTGDEGTDLVLSGSCEAGTCFFVFPNIGGELGPAEVWGIDDVGADHRLTAADVNGDGLDDLVFVEQCRTGACAQAYVNGDPGLTEVVDLAPAPIVSADLAVGEFEADREVDLIYHWRCGRAECTQSLAVPAGSSDLIPDLAKTLSAAGLATISPEVIARIT